MEEQAKTTQENEVKAEVKEEKSSSENSKMVLKIILGVILVILGIWAVIGWWSSLVTVFKGCIGLFLLMAGAITFAIAKE